MTGDQRNAASDVAERVAELLTDPAGIPDAAPLLTDDFVYRDRRKMIGLAEVDKTAFLHNVIPFHFEALPDTSNRTVLATRGDRLVLTRPAHYYQDGSVREYLALSELDDTGSAMRRLTHFDVGDLDGALAELERLHAEVEADAG